MRRVLFVAFAMAVMFAVGYFLGQRPVKPLRAEMAQLTGEFTARQAEIEKAAAISGARSDLLRARSDLYAAAAQVTRSNFGLAAENAKHAGELIARSAAVPGVEIDASTVQTSVSMAVELLSTLDLGARDILERAADDLGRLLN